MPTTLELRVCNTFSIRGRRQPAAAFALGRRGRGLVHLRFTSTSANWTAVSSLGHSGARRAGRTITLGFSSGQACETGLVRQIPLVQLLSARDSVATLCTPIGQEEHLSAEAIAPPSLLMIS